MFLIPSSFWKIKKTKKKGRGVFATRPIFASTLIGDYVGKLVHLRDFDFEEENKKLYLMYYNHETGIYPDTDMPGVYLINHSCSPNCWIIQLKDHTVVFALKNITKGTELTISYLLPPKKLCKPCPHICRCQSKTCAKTMHLTEGGYKIWQEFQDKLGEKDLPKTKGGTSELKPLKKYPKSISKKLLSEIKALQNELYR